MPASHSLKVTPEIIHQRLFSLAMLRSFHEVAPMGKNLKTSYVTGEQGVSGALTSASTAVEQYRIYKYMGSIYSRVISLKCPPLESPPFFSHPSVTETKWISRQSNTRPNSDDKFRNQ